MSLQTEVIAHHLALFGLPSEAPGFPLLLDRPAASDAAVAAACAGSGKAVVAVCPTPGFTEAFAIRCRSLPNDPPLVLSACAGIGKAWGRLRSLHPALAFERTDGSELEPIVVNSDAVVWGSIRLGASQLFLLGTELAADLVRYRQGDPEAALDRPTEAKWGIPGERPDYLFDKQLTGEHPHDRPADWWCWTLREALERSGGLTANPILPGGAVGAVIVTGDDDQAGLEFYGKQKRLLGDLPVTYFLHPLTKHDRASLTSFSRARTVEWGLHPDALDAPEKYAPLFAGQFRWFEELTGYPARIVRNHGFLNDGYWGHLPTWLVHGITASSNLPGVDGRVLNGSLLPARLVHDGQLTGHWSLLTAIGDGIMFALAMSSADAEACVLDAGDRIRSSGVPGMLVLNLHPANVDATLCMHEAVRELVSQGFVALTLSEAIGWFLTGDDPTIRRSPKTSAMRALHGLVRPDAWRSLWRDMKRSAT